MEFNQFFYPDSHHDAEVCFILELISLLQNEFNQPVSLKIHTERDLSHLVDRYLWSIKPRLVSSAPEQSDVYIDLFEHEIKFKAEAFILSSAQSFEVSKTNYIPQHLLQSEIDSEDITTAKAYSIAKIIIGKKFSSHEVTQKISLFYSDELREWLSLMEASDSLIAFWYRQRDEKTDLELVNLNQLKTPGEIKQAAFTSKRNVILKITPRSSQIIKTLRTYNPECPLTIHGFESASVFFSNTFLYELQDFLKEEDLWVVSCESDAKLARLAWEKINTVVIPLRFPDLHKNLKIKSDKKNLLFFGRITEQKNLHEGLMAVKILEDRMRSENRKFKVFGYEDFLGVPNLRIPSLGYLEYLFKLAKKLKIEDLVEFHPAVAVNRMEEEFKNGIFFSPSIHSDENFGLVAFRALNSGVPAVLSQWGGHQDFSTMFKDVRYFRVYQTGKGPKCNPFEIASAIVKIWNDDSFSPASKHTNITLTDNLPGQTAMRPSDLKKEIEGRINDSFPWRVRKWPLYGKIFKNYGDQKYQLALTLYGAVKRPSPEENSQYLSPEVEILDSELKVLDCRAGVLRYSRIEEIHNRRVKKLDNSEVLLSDSEWSWLWENGYIYSRESYEL